MEAIRRKRIKRTGKQIVIDLPEDFKAEEVDLIVWPSQEEKTDEIPINMAEWKKQTIEAFSKFTLDLSNLKYTRDELYDRT